MTQYHMSHESGVMLLLSSHKSSVISHQSRVISHESWSHKETVRVMSRFHDITSLLMSNVQGLVADLNCCLAQHLVLVLMVRVDFACHGSKGPWLEVSVDVTCSAQVLSVFHKVEERIHKTRGVDSLGLETKLRLRSQRYLVQALNSTTPRGLPSFVIVTTSPMMTSDDVTSCTGHVHRS
jgi:hypothetical protein